MKRLRHKIFGDNKFNDTRVGITLRYLWSQKVLLQRDFTSFYSKAGAYSQKDLNHFNRFTKGRSDTENPLIEFGEQYMQVAPQASRKYVRWIGPETPELWFAELDDQELNHALAFWERRLTLEPEQMTTAELIFQEKPIEWITRIRKFMDLRASVLIQLAEDNKKGTVSQ